MYDITEIHDLSYWRVGGGKNENLFHKLIYYFFQNL